MTFSSEHDDFRRTIRRYIEEKINPRVDEWEREQMMPLHEVIADMAKLGFVGLEYDPEYGGQGADHLFTLVLAEELRPGGSRVLSDGLRGSRRDGHPLAAQTRKR